MYHLRFLKRMRKTVTAATLFSVFVQAIGISLFQAVLWFPQQVSAAEVVIDSAVSTAANANNFSGTQTVFLDDDIGYTFYKDSNSQCVYSKTTDSGATWGTAVTVDSQTDCLKVVVWYDRWTPGDTTGTNIHIATMDSSDDRIFYNRLDTSGDTLLLGSSPVNTGVNSGQGGSFTDSINAHTITKATDGKVYVAVNDVSDSYALSCSVSCNLTTSWNEVGTSPFDTKNDFNLLAPLAGGNVLVINRDTSADDLRSAVWNGSTWSGWTNIDTNAPESSTYDASMSVSVNKDTGDVYLAYVADIGDNSANDDIRTAVYSSGAWSAGGDVITDDTGELSHVAIAIDQNTGDVYVAYGLMTVFGVAGTGNVYWKSSSNNMTSWSTQQGPLNTLSGDIYGVSMNLYDPERLYATWFEAGASDRFGETVADLGPDTILSSIGSQKTQEIAGNTGVYVGGTFVITSISSRTVSGITIDEVGTIDAQTGLNNIELYYDLDTTSPYDCVDESYGGVEDQFGSTDTNGFSGSNGESAFAGSIVAISPTQTMCVYVVLDVTSSATDGSVIEIQVSNPDTDITVSGETVFPSTVVELAGGTTIVSPALTQSNYHWRNDDGSETAATSATGGSENTPIAALSKSNPRRLRIEISNEGSTSTFAAPRLEFGTAAPTCGDVASWTDVGATDDAWNMSNSANLTDGNNTTNISLANGGVTDENTTFITPNAGVKDTSSTVTSLEIDTTEFIELEYSIVASTSATEGETYCFRLTDAGTELNSYTSYPQVTIDADVTVSVNGSHIASADIPSTNNYLGGVFVIQSNTGALTVDQIIVSETGSVDGSSGLENIKLFVESDTSAPYDCTSESYGGGETQFGATDTDGFSSANGTSSFSGSVGISNTSSLCVYVVTDVTSAAATNETVSFQITSPTTDVGVGAASVAPGTPVSITGSTTLQGGLLTQTHYQWRNDDGSESAATSATGGSEDTVLNDFSQSTPIRLRIQISNEGATTSLDSRFQLEFSPKITTCDAVGIWTAVDAVGADDWDEFDSSFLTHAADSTNIAEAIGGVTDENTTFLTPNAAVLDTDSITGSTTILNSEFVEIEYSLQSTSNTAFNTTYCFRVSDNGTDLPVYTNYAEIRTSAKADYKVQRGRAVISGTTVTITAGVDYTVPAAANTAFVRITNSHYMGAGNTTGGGRQNADDVTAFVSNPANIFTSVTFERAGAVDDTAVDWEIVEFIGQPGTDNQIIVRDVGVQAFTSTDLVATGTSIAVTDDADVVVFITGIKNSNTSRNYYAGLVTTDWSGGTDEPVFTRGSTGGAAIDVSYAVVEYVGDNWKIQRTEHAYAAAGVTETESITAVNSLTRTYLHTQKRMGADVNVEDFGHTVWISSVGAVSFALESGALVPDQVSVAWVIENTQTGLGSMNVQRTNGSTSNGAEPLTASVSIVTPLGLENNGSIFMNTRSSGADFNHPRALAGARITSVSSYELWRSDTGSTLTYRTEIVEWPVADLAIRQNYYRFYNDNNTLTPSDPWPPGGTDLGENTSITLNDEPLGVDDYLRLRVSLKVSNANLPAGFQRFKLQFGERTTTCTAVSAWSDLGDTASSSAWRGFAGGGTTDGDTLSSDPPLPGDLVLSVSDVAGRLVHQNPSALNVYSVFETEDIEYDWYIQQNGANPETTYCFRMIRDDNSPIEGYFNYPQIRTAGFTPVSKNWRWYSDPVNETPLSPLAAENVAPANIGNDDTLALRLTILELANVNSPNTKFKLQFSDDISFTNPVDVVATSSCQESSLWCFTDGGGVDNELITTSLLSDNDGCTGATGNGCGTHNESPAYTAGHLHGASRALEYSFAIEQANARVNAVYYFRLINLITGEPVQLDTSEEYPTLLSGASELTFSVTGLPAGTTTAGVVTDATTTATDVNFGSIPFNDDYIAAQRISVETNATQGYQVFKYASQNLLNSYGVAIDSITATNAIPDSWVTACSVTATGCVGYHTTDAVLEGSSPESTRFGATDTYAALSVTPVEIMFNSLPLADTVDIIYRIQVTEDQPAGDYITDITYLAVPVF
jgi:hypothetical protein